MSNGHGNGVAMANRITTWVAIAAMGVYVLNMGQWVGAADEKLADAEAVEVQVDAVKDRLTKVEVNLDNLEKTVEKGDEAILKALAELKQDVKDSQ